MLTDPPGDHDDWWKFTLGDNQDGYVTVRWETTQGSMKFGDILILMDSNGVEIAKNENPYKNGLQVSACLNQGNYCIHLYKGSTPCEYNVWVDLQPLHVDEIEPNDSCNEANLLPLGEVKNGILTSDSDKDDYWTITLEEGQNCKLTVDWWAIKGALGFGDLMILSKNGVEIEVYGTIPIVAFLNSDTYCLRLYKGSGSCYYAVRASLENVTIQEEEKNNDCENNAASYMPVGPHVQGILTVEPDRDDYWRFTLEEGQNHDVDIVWQSINPEFPLIYGDFLGLKDCDGSGLVIAEEFAPDMDGIIRIPNLDLKADHQYFIRLYKGQKSCAYDLWIE